ncbi:MAG: thioredoxin domain-containing protein [Microbacterium sp.]
MAAAKKVNWFAILVSGIVLVLVVVVVVVSVWMNHRATALADSPGAGVVNSDTGGITIGEQTDNTLETYIDFMCPYCGMFETQYWGDDIADAVDAGELTLTVYPVAILDAQSEGTQYSTRASNALYCVTDENADAAYPFLRALFDNQPSEGTSGLTDEQLISYAKKAGAGDAADCITDLTYGDFVSKVTDALPTNSQTGNKSTPAVLFNGTEVNDWTTTTLADYLG